MRWARPAWGRPQDFATETSVTECQRAGVPGEEMFAPRGDEADLLAELDLGDIHLALAYIVRRRRR
eukprot:7856931-Pyramimonas_sp.AAC.1